MAFLDELASEVGRVNVLLHQIDGRLDKITEDLKRRRESYALLLAAAKDVIMMLEEPRHSTARDTLAIKWLKAAIANAEENI